jgi:hypothetical protein
MGTQGADYRRLSHLGQYLVPQDFFRAVVRPAFTEVTRDGDGVAEFESLDDM